MSRFIFNCLLIFFQFYLEDENSEHLTDHIWNDQEAMETGLGLGKGLIAVGTERNLMVPVSVEIHDSEPEEDFSHWKKIIECSIDVPSGTIVVFGCTDDRAKANRIQVAPGSYRVRVYFGTINTFNEFEQGSEIIKIVFWVTPFLEGRILKKKPKMA